MAVSSIAWMLLGSVRSLGPSARRGVATLTDTTPASGAVAAATRSARSRMRGTTPMTTSVTPSATPISRPHPFFDSGIGRILREKVLARRTPAQDAVDDGNQEERGECRHREATDDRAPQRRILLAALPEAQRHRQHADDHRERGHQDRAQSRGAGSERGGAG